VGALLVGTLFVPIPVTLTPLSRLGLWAQASTELVVESCTAKPRMSARGGWVQLTFSVRNPGDADALVAPGASILPGGLDAKTPGIWESKGQVLPGDGTMYALASKSTVTSFDWNVRVQESAALGEQYLRCELWSSPERNAKKGQERDFPRGLTIVSPTPVDLTVARFQWGRMIWRGNPPIVLVLYEDTKTVEQFKDTFTGVGGTEDPGRGDNCALQEPIRGFDKVWRDNNLRGRVGVQKGHEWLQPGTWLDLEDHGTAQIVVPGFGSWLIASNGAYIGAAAAPAVRCA
jgi:hypothetical protein